MTTPTTPSDLVRNYNSPKDREAVGLIASSLAFGSSQQYLKAIWVALKPLGAKPHAALSDWTFREDAYYDFSHYFVTGIDLLEMMYGYHRLVNSLPSLGKFVKQAWTDTKDILRVMKMCSYALLPDRVRDTAGKEFLLVTPGTPIRFYPLSVDTCSQIDAGTRICMYFRWMIRKDGVDPGGPRSWRSVPRSKLIVPLDTDTHAKSVKQGWTSRRIPSWRAALEVTHNLRKLNQDDPLALVV